MNKIHNVSVDTYANGRGYYVISQIVGSKEFNEQVPLLNTTVSTWGQRSIVGRIVAKIYETNPTRWEHKDYKNKPAYKTSTLVSYVTDTLSNTHFLHNLKQIQDQYFQSSGLRRVQGPDGSWHVHSNKSLGIQSDSQSVKPKIDTKKYFSIEQYSKMNRLRKEYGDPELGLLSCKSVEDALHKIDDILKVHKRREAAYRIVCEDLAYNHSLTRQSLDELKKVHQAYEKILAEKTQWHAKAMVEIQYYYDNFANCPDLLPLKKLSRKRIQLANYANLLTKLISTTFALIMI